MKARYGELGADTFRSLAHCPPTIAGISTLWPRLDIGKSSVTPWSSPTIPASPYVRCDMPALRSRAKTNQENHDSERSRVPLPGPPHHHGQTSRPEHAPATRHPNRQQNTPTAP